jgi:hypothetical protein
VTKLHSFLPTQSKRHIQYKIPNFGAAARVAAGVAAMQAQPD